MTPAQITIGAAAIILVAVVGVIGALALGDDDEPRDTASKRPASRSRGITQVRTIGVRIRRPRGWVQKRARRSISFRSPDRTILLSVSLPPGARQSAGVLEAALAAIRQGYSRVRTAGDPRARRLANLPTRSAIASAMNQRGVRLRILTAVPQGRRRAWLVQVFAAEGVDNMRLRPAQRALDSMRLSG